MPRLLLVDDNPSIHRIAESLLAHTDVELVCVDSAAEALDRIGRGERFDVALVDTTMPGMDGWTLLDRLRAMEETAHMPIALMAGVLDPVDPAKLAKAPVQGFLKKPIELRELGDRVKALLATPVVSAPEPSAFTTMPARPAKDLVRLAESSFPEFRPESRPEMGPEMGPEVEPVDAPQAAHPALLALPALPASGDDLLVLTAEDLWPEDPPAAPVPVVAVATAPDIHLELEELDMESLQDLAAGPLVSEAVPPAPLVPLTPMAAIAPDPAEDDPITFSGLEDLEGYPAEFDPLLLLPEPAPQAEAGVPPGHLAATGALDLLVAATAPQDALQGETPGPDKVQAPESEPIPQFEPVSEPFDMPFLTETSAVPGQVPAVPGQVPAVPGQAPALSSEQAQALLQAILVDPALVDALVKAVVARMGDQVIREIAWEVMPDLAGRLQR